MYVFGRIEVEETVSILSLEEPEVRFSLEEFEHYVDLFEEMQERLDNEKDESQDGFGWNSELDEFDLADIAEMRERCGLILED